MRTMTLCTLAALGLCSVSTAHAARPQPRRAPNPPPPPMGPGPRPAPVGSNAASTASLKASLVTVLVTSQDHDQRAPWTKVSPRQHSYTAAVVQGRMLLMGASVLQHATLVEVRRPGEENTYDATVKLVDQEPSLALLDVADPAFWQGLRPLPVAQDIPVDGDVLICRWLGNNQFEAARGTVKQVRVSDHGVGRVDMLTLDLATTLTQGGLGEVVVKDGALVGLATQRGQNTLGAVAAPMLRQFLNEATGSVYRGFARHGFRWQKLLNPALRAHLRLTAKDGGVLVTQVYTPGSASGILQRGDVLLSVAGFRVDEAGQFTHPRWGKLFFGLLFSLGHAPGDVLELGIMRAGKRLTLKTTLRQMPAKADLVPAYEEGAPPWVMRGGLVFQQLTMPYLSVFGDWRQRAPMLLGILADQRGSEPQADGTKVVILSTVLPDTVNLGFQDHAAGLVVRAVNGVAVHTLSDAEAAFSKPPAAGFHVVEFAPGQRLARLVLEVDGLEAAEQRIRQQYNVPDPHR